MQKTGWREDILRRADASMQLRRDCEESAAIKAMIDRDLALQKREAMAWRIMIGLIMAGILVALVIRHAGVTN